MARVFTSFLVGLGLSLAAPSAHAEIVIEDTDAFGDAQAYVDQNGDGFLLEDEGETFFSREQGVLSFSASLDASSSPSESSMRHTTNISASATSVNVTSSGTCDATTTRGGAYKEAEATLTFQMRFTVSATTQLSLNGSFEASGDGTATWNVASIAGEAFAGAAAVNERLTLEPGQYFVYVACDAHAYYDESRTPKFANASSSWGLGLTLTEGEAECEPEAVSWAGGREGDFDIAENWEPPRVPLLDEAAGRCDEILIRGGRGLVLDLDGFSAPAIAVAEGAAPTPIKRHPRLTVDAHRELQPVDGTIEGTELSPIAGERSVEVINGGSLLLNGGGVFARHLGVGSIGEGAIEVGPDGYLETTGRLGLGIAGSGHLLVRDGAGVTSAEGVLGESEAQGSARVEGALSFWQTGNLAIGLESDGALAIEAGGQVFTDKGAIDFDLEGDERGRVEVRGKTPNGTPSEWTLDELDVGPLGSLLVAAGGKTSVSTFLRIGRKANGSACGTGTGSVQIEDGEIAASDLAVGFTCPGELRVGPLGTLAASGTTVIGSTQRSRMDVDGTNQGVQVELGSLAIATNSGWRGILELRNGAELTLAGPLQVGTSEGSDGRVYLNAGNDGGRVAFIQSHGPAVFGHPSDVPHARRPITASLELVPGSFHSYQDVLIEGTGGLQSQGGRVTLFGEAKLRNRGAVTGVLTVEGDYVQGATGMVLGTVLESPLPSPAPQLRSPSSLLLGPLAAAPPPPSFAPMIVTGNATLAGTAKLQFGNGVAPKQGDAFELLQVEGEVTGAFDEVEVAGLAPGAGFASEIVNGALVLTSLTDAEPLPYVNIAGKPVLLETKKGAKVKLTRTGDNSGPLTVAYTVAGTAESGVDYVALPGAIEFPAGKKSVTLLVQPIADALEEGVETIELTLAPDASFAPGLASALTLELRDGKTK